MHHCRPDQFRRESESNCHRFVEIIRSAFLGIQKRMNELYDARMAKRHTFLPFPFHQILPNMRISSYHLSYIKCVGMLVILKYGLIDIHVIHTCI